MTDTESASSIEDCGANIGVHTVAWANLAVHPSNPTRQTINAKPSA